MRLQKSGKSQGKSHKILENWGNFRQMLFVIFQWQLNEFVYYLLNLIKCSVKKTITEKILENGKNTGKVREKSGNFVSLEKWEPCFIHQPATDVIFKFSSLKSTYSGKVVPYEIHKWAKGTKKTNNIKNRIVWSKDNHKSTYLKTS